MLVLIQTEHKARPNNSNMKCHIAERPMHTHCISRKLHKRSSNVVRPEAKCIVMEQRVPSQKANGPDFNFTGILMAKKSNNGVGHSEEGIRYRIH